MTTYPGSVRVTGFIAPSDTSDTYATHDSRFSLGGGHEVADHTERDAIPDDRRREGLSCYTANDKITWQLQGGIANSNWIAMAIGSAGVSIAEIAFAYGDATPRTIFTTVGTQRVWSVELSIDVPFNGTTPALKIGDAGNTSRLMATTQNDPKTVNVYSTSPAYEYAAGTAIILTITPGSGASAGSGKIQLFF